MTLKPLPDIDLQDRYGRDYANFYMGDPRPISFLPDNLNTIPTLLRRLEHEENPVALKHDILDLAQLLFDGIVRLPGGGFWDEKRACLSAICQAGKRCVGSFYRGEPEEPAVLREILFPYATTLTTYAGCGPPKVRHLRRDSTLQVFGQSLPEMFPGLSGIEALVSIASGGFEPSFLLMDMLDCPLLPVCYSWMSRNDRSPHVPRLQKKSYFSALRGKQVLIVDDVVSSGKTLWKVSRRVASAQPKALYGCAVTGYNEQSWYSREAALEMLVSRLRPSILQIGQHFLCSLPLRQDEENVLTTIPIIFTTP